MSGDRLVGVEPGSEAANGVPTPEDRERRRLAFTTAEQVLGRHLAGGVLRCSPLGPEWSSDIDAHLIEPPPPEALEAAGWLPLGGLLRKLGRRGDDRWAVVDPSGRVLGAVDITTEPAPDPVEAVLARARRRREVRVREVLELRRLADEGRSLPADPVVSLAASIEAGFRHDPEAGESPTTAVRAPAPLPRRPGLRSMLGQITRPVRRRRIGIGLSGVDGSGKSTLARELVDSMERAGVPATIVWSRPGMGLQLLNRGVQAVKRVLGESPEPGVRRVAAGDDGAVRSRRGALGWTWALIVVIAYLSDVWRQQLRADGVVVHDRHLVDAHVTLDVLYAGAPLRLHHRVIDVMLPRVSVGAYVDVPPQVAVARKPGDTIGELAVRRQLESYERRLPADATRLDGAAALETNVARLLGDLVRAVGAT